MGINEIIAQGTWKAPVIESNDNKLLSRLKLEREQLELDGLRANKEQSNRLAEYMRGTDPANPDYAKGMRQISPQAAFEYEDKQLAREKDRAGLRSSKVTADQGEFKLASEKYDGLLSDITGLKDNPQLSKPLVAATLQRRVQQGLMSQELFDDMVGSLPDDPAQIRTTADQFLRSKLTPEQQYTVFAPKPVERTDGATKTMMDENPLSPGFNKPLSAPVQLQVSPDAKLTDARTRSEGDKTRAVSVRGQDITKQGQVMSDERARELNKITADNKPLNETQSKAALFGSRMTMANKIFDDLGRSGTSASVPGINSGYGIGTVVNALSSKDQQSLMQAKRDFVNAVLRRESGAAIAPSEFDNAERQYFPQIGEGKEQIAQKKANREAATRGILIDVPSNKRDAIVTEITGGSTKGASGSWDDSGKPGAYVPSADDNAALMKYLPRGGK